MPQRGKTNDEMNTYWAIVYTLFINRLEKVKTRLVK